MALNPNILALIGNYIEFAKNPVSLQFLVTYSTLFLKTERLSIQKGGIH